MFTLHHRTAVGRRSRRLEPRAPSDVLRCASMPPRRPPPPKKPRAQKAKATSVADALSALREEVAALTRAVAASPETAVGLVSRLRDSADLLARSAAELPRAEDFQPLADHLYSFAQSAPRLMES